MGGGVCPPAYMAPEHWDDAALAGPPADVYALGLILYELLVGRHALADLHLPHSQQEWREAHAQRLPQAPRPLRVGAPRVPQAVEELDLACLAKRPDDRPSAQEATRVQHAALKDISGT